MSQVTYGGSGADTRAFGYNALHELTSDTLASGSTTVASVGYGYNADGDLTSKTTTGFAGASASTYGYDQAGRLTSWNNGTTTTSYAYDGAGNRVQAGSTTYTFDARDELTSDGTSSYAYTANGDLASVTGPSGTVTSTSDAYGQQGAQGSQSSTYDALGRDVQIAVTSGSTATATALSYEGTTGQLAGDGAYAYTWTPGGILTGTANAGSPGTGVLDFTDRHTDLAGQFTPAGATLTGSRSFGPWGVVTATGGTLTGSLGYQSQYTSPATGQVDMGARWYNPATGSFGNKDTVSNKPVPDSASASPFGYAAGNPLGGTDPTGHMVSPFSGSLSPAQVQQAARIEKASIDAAAGNGARQAAAYHAPATHLDAHQLHLAHLARLAALGQTARTAPVTKPAPRAGTSPSDASGWHPVVPDLHRQPNDWAGWSSLTSPQPGTPTTADRGTPKPAAKKPATPVDSPIPHSGSNPLSGVRSLTGAGATALSLLSGIVGSGASSSEAEINALLGTSGTEALAKLHSAIGDLANMSPSDLAQFLNPDEIAAVQEKGTVWFGRVFYGTAAERAVANAVADVPEIIHLGNSQVAKSVADFYVIGENAAIPFDLTGPSVSSVASHMKKWFVGSSNQILTYARPSSSFLKSVFGI